MAVIETEVFSTLLRDTVRTMVADHEVYVTDWFNARDVPLAAGRFGLDEYTAHLIEFLKSSARVPTWWRSTRSCGRRSTCSTGDRGAQAALRNAPGVVPNQRRTQRAKFEPRW